MIEFLILALSIVSLWFLFEKAGDHGWKALIPIYNSYTLCRISECVGLFVARLVVNVLLFTEAVVALFIFAFSYSDLYVRAMTSVYAGEADSTNFMLEYLTPSVLAAIIVFGLLFLLLFISSVTMSILIARKFTKCFTEQKSLVVLACLGAFPPLYILQLISFCILAFDKRYTFWKGTPEQNEKSFKFYSKF